MTSPSPTLTLDSDIARSPRAEAHDCRREEVSLPVAAGDLMVLDARLLHAAHANASDVRRPALSLWYATDVAALPESVRARFSLEPREGSRLPYVPESWSVGARRRLAAVLPPRYAGSEKPLPIANDPGPRLS